MACADDDAMDHPPIAVVHAHDRGRAQSWETGDGDLRSFVLASVDAVGRQLGGAGFVGAYLHGSLAMGPFYRPKSDLDLLLVVDQALSTDDRRAVAYRLAAEHSGDRVAYAEAKTAFVGPALADAERWATRTGWNPGT